MSALKLNASKVDFLILNSLEKMLKMTRIRLEHIFWVFVFFVLAIFEFFSKDEVKN